MFDYQSDCHCSKTQAAMFPMPYCLTTSQIATVPKQSTGDSFRSFRLTTSQIATVPKLCMTFIHYKASLTTSQIATVPKLVLRNRILNRV